MIAVCANYSCSRGRRSWLSVALLLEDRDADRNHPNRGLCLVVAAADGLPATASSSLIQFLLVAREDGIWSREDSRHFALGVGRPRRNPVWTYIGPPGKAKALIDGSLTSLK